MSTIASLLTFAKWVIVLTWCIGAVHWAGASLDLWAPPKMAQASIAGACALTAETVMERWVNEGRAMAKALKRRGQPLPELITQTSKGWHVERYANGSAMFVRDGETDPYGNAQGQGPYQQQAVGYQSAYQGGVNGQHQKGET